MNDTQINCFLAVCQTLNFSRAAEILFITQPALSYQIRSLEKELGVKLFTRSTTQVRLTDAGQALVEPAHTLARQYLTILNTVRPYAEKKRLTLFLPAVMTMRDPIYHELLHRMHEKLSEYDISIRTDCMPSLLQARLAHSADAMIRMHPPTEETGVTYTPLFQTKCYLVASPQHPLTRQPQPLSLRALSGYTICYEPNELDYIHCLQEQLSRLGGSAQWIEVESYELSYPEMLSGKALFVSPVKYDAFPQLWYLPLQTNQLLPQTCLFTLTDDKRPCIATLIELVRDLYQNNPLYIG
jgi:DNA-binding transcriptional LysR family regulator